MDKNSKNNLKDAIVKSGRSLCKALPMIFGTVLLISLIYALVPKSFYTAVFSKNIFLDSVIGGLVGSVSAGTPITSYILGGELLSQGVSLGLSSFPRNQ
jgi:hypothetical protein